MIHRYPTIQDAFAVAKRVSSVTGGPAGVLAWVFSDHTRGFHYVATSAGFGRIRELVGGGWRGGRGTEFRCGSLDFCGDHPQLTPEQWTILADRFPVAQPELPGHQEAWYQLCAAHTAGWNHEQLLGLARTCDETGCGVWHASHLLHKELNPGTKHKCPCGPCEKSI